MWAVDVVILIGSILLVIEWIIKLIKPDFKIRGNAPPCGITMLVLGVGFALKAIGVWEIHQPVDIERSINQNK